MKSASRPLEDLSPTGMLPCDVARLTAEPHEPPHTLRRVMWGLVVVAALAAVFSLAGCVAQETKALVSTGAAVADGHLREWDSLTDAQKKRTAWKLARAFHVLDFDINDVELAPEWREKEPPK